MAIRRLPCWGQRRISLSFPPIAIVLNGAEDMKSFLTETFFWKTSFCKTARSTIGTGKLSCQLFTASHSVASVVYYSILFTHMMPELFSDPECFDPERFAPPRCEDERTPFSLIGFGGGPRTCIGRGFARLEMKIIAATLLHGYECKVSPGQNLRASYSPTKRPRDGLRVAIKAKDKN